MLTLEDFKREALKDPALKREYDAQSEEFLQISKRLKAERHVKHEPISKTSTPAHHSAPLETSLA